MPRPARSNPTTCREAAARFREWAERSPYERDAGRYEACADILEAFGDAPVPQDIINNWDFTR